MNAVLSLVCILVVCVNSAPTQDKISADKERLSVLVKELSDVVQDLTQDVKDIEEKEAEPAADAEVNEMETEARLEDKRRKGNEAMSEEEERNNELETKDKDLREELKLLLALARQRTTKDNHDWPMPFNRQNNQKAQQ